MYTLGQLYVLRLAEGSAASIYWSVPALLFRRNGRQCALRLRKTSAIILGLIASLALGSNPGLGQSDDAESNITPSVAVSDELQSPTLVAEAIADLISAQPQIEVGPWDYPYGINPLTGLPYPNEQALERRNLIVKISNWPPKVRPQRGINQADLVYEYEAEGGVTRFAAIFRNNAPKQVGSIRSARLLDIELISMYAALLAYSGTSAPIHDIYINAPFGPYCYLHPWATIATAAVLSG